MLALLYTVQCWPVGLRERCYRLAKGRDHSPSSASMEQRDVIGYAPGCVCGFLSPAMQEQGWVAEDVANVSAS